MFGFKITLLLRRVEKDIVKRERGTSRFHSAFSPLQSGEATADRPCNQRIFCLWISVDHGHWRCARCCKRSHRAIFDWRNAGARRPRILTANARKKFFANDLAVLHRVNANLRQFHSLFRLLVRDIRIELHDESIVRRISCCVPESRFSGTAMAASLVD